MGDELGTYIITAKAMDTYGLESNWRTLKVTMPRNKIATNAKQLTIVKFISY